MSSPRVGLSASCPVTRGNTSQATAPGPTFGADGHKTHALALDKLQRLVDVRQFVDAHLAAIRLRQLFAGDDLQQQHQLEPVAKVLLDRLDLRAGLAKMRVAPGRERLQQIARRIRTCIQYAAPTSPPDKDLFAAIGMPLSSH